MQRLNNVAKRRLVDKVAILTGPVEPHAGVPPMVVQLRPQTLVEQHSTKLVARQIRAVVKSEPRSVPCEDEAAKGRYCG